ncbi:hypothetical protein [Streptomyces pseudovenezuelae]|uniref:hypothetical protein n=1 Tax=Streptomyces pseudovenezuelae TaxID=67350 RepID=UPI002E8060EB|nr:hypothetical protein [Streptomyces pseudovenezuelae]WUA87698.1 hypothetical protein OHO81_10535 [Streptomyces pseudovenezuelae]
MPDPAPPPRDDPTTTVPVTPLLSTYEMFQKLMAAPRAGGPPAHDTDPGRP